MIKPTDEESADLKHRLRTLPWSEALAAETQQFPAEADEALIEAETGQITCKIGSWVDVTLMAQQRGGGR